VRLGHEIVVAARPRRVQHLRDDGQPGRRGPLGSISRRVPL